MLRRLAEKAGIEFTEEEKSFLYRRKQMGFYINPKHESKEIWLMSNGTPVANDISEVLFEDFYSGDELPVCLVSNGSFTAAGICYSEGEFEIFKRYDGRLKRWFGVSINSLLEVCPELKMKLEQKKRKVSM